MRIFLATQIARQLLAVLAVCAATRCCDAQSDAGETATHLARGRIEFSPLPNEQSLPAHFRLKAHAFNYEQAPWREVKGAVSISHVRFPSPVKTKHEVNNVVHCEFFQPLQADGTPHTKTPGVIVLHILGGDFELARAFCMAISRRGGAALFLKMPYYGPRRPTNSRRRMVSEDPHQTVEGFTQAVLDIRRAAAWLGEQKTVDEKRLGIFGISLGGITGALAMGVEPRLHNGCLLLAGGDLAGVFWESDETRKQREKWTAAGGTREQFEKIVASIDPISVAQRARSRRVLMINAKDDEVVPRAATVSLWKALGEPRIVWYDGGHYSVAKHFFSAIREVGDFYAKAESLPESEFKP